MKVETLKLSKIVDLNKIKVVNKQNQLKKILNKCQISHWV